MMNNEMKRRAKVVESIEKAVNAGYEFLEEGKGSQDAALEKYRAQGYDVKGWYTCNKKDNREYVMYGKKKGQRRSAQTKKVEINFETLTVKDLKKLCSEKKIVGYSKMNKQQMVTSLKEAC